MYKITDKLCSNCYYSTLTSEGCSYMYETGQSRLRDKDGNRYDPQYCDKYKEGRKEFAESWQKRKMGNYKL